MCVNSNQMTELHYAMDDAILKEKQQPSLVRESHMLYAKL